MSATLESARPAESPASPAPTPPPKLRHRLQRTLQGATAELARGWAERHLEVATIREAAEAEGFADLGSGYRDAYLVPLLRLLGACLGGGPADWAAIYVDERLRFVPDPATDIEALRAVLERDERDLVELCGEDASLGHAMKLELRRLHAPLREEASERVGLVMVGDCLMTELRALASVQAREHGVQLDARHFYFSARQGVGLDTDQVTSAVARDSGDLIALSFLTYEGIPAYRALLLRADDLGEESIRREVEVILAVVADFVKRIRQVTPATILLHGVCGLPLTRYRKRIPLVPALSRGRRRALKVVNTGLRELAGATENAVFIDEEQVTCEAGLRRSGAALLPRRLTAGAMFHPTRLSAALAPVYTQLAQAQAALGAAKVLLVDFDNTLWQGVMAEGEVVHERARQHVLKQLREAGVLLVALSKNSTDSIRWDELELAPEDFVLQKVSWNQKVQSVLEAAQQLDLAPDSFVLIDDNPAERELVRQQIPEVRALDSDDPATWQALEWMLELPVTGRSVEAARRTEMYREAAARREALATELDLPAMMRSLELRATFGPARDKDIGRVHELVARTNQFNTTTRRRSESELRALAGGEDHGVYVATLGDKFGDLGLVGVVIVERSGSELAFDSVVMSCRAMGFGLEYLMLQAALDAEAPWQRAVGRYVPTARNNPCAGLFASAGFKQLDEAEWVLAATDESPEAPDWLSVSRR